MRRIESRHNPRFKQLLSWAQSMKTRRQDCVIFLEGFHLIQSWLDVGRGSEGGTLLIADSALAHSESAGLLTESLAWQEILALPDHLFAALSEAETPQGLLAILPYQPQAVLAQTDRDSLLLDGLQDPGNLGTLLRTAAAAGFTQILLSPGCASPWSGKALRAGQGAQFLLQLVEQQDLSAFLSAFAGVSLATTPTASESLFADKSLPLDLPLAWIFGSEGQGISAEVLAGASRQLSIPMPGAVESINVAAAAAICLFETLRQRRGTFCRISP